MAHTPDDLVEKLADAAYTCAEAVEAAVREGRATDWVRAYAEATALITKALDDFRRQSR